MHIRDWLEFPQSSCLTEWASSPLNICGHNIPTFAQRAARMKLTRRHLLQISKNQNIRELWEDSRGPNTLADSMLGSFGFKTATKMLKKAQATDSLTHYLGLKSQGVVAKIVSETILSQNIHIWKQVLDSLPDHVHNFVRKAMMNQLPTLHNLKLWNCSPTNLCPRCGKDQTNKHVLSHCSSPDALVRYTSRHNAVLEIIAKWILSHLQGANTLHCDLTIPGTRHVCDLFNGPRPDLAIVSPSRIVIGELTVCHETNLLSSRDYKLNKYSSQI